MNLDRVTVTGADDSVDPNDLAALSKRFPFVEWGILLSRSQEGNHRFPTLNWILHLNRVRGACASMGAPLKLSGHLCGQWVRALCRGSRRFEAERPALRSLFQRVQLNFHAQEHDVAPDLFVEVLQMWEREEYIFQVDGVNNHALGTARNAGVNAVPLFDKSGGAGVEPGEWPAPFGSYCGYAGGLHPDILREQLGRIALAAGDSRVWIDVETHVRSADDRQFDLAKVEKFLTVAEPWVHT